MEDNNDYGKEINRRFGQPAGSAKGAGKETLLSFAGPVQVNHVIISENLRKGQRIRKYVVEGKINGVWKTIREGSSVGQKRIEYFETVAVEKLRLLVTESAGIPDIAAFSAYL